MKFRKTKLTALAMSVLMAASTITSVTWAADLFTNGAPAEVAVEAPVEVVSDVEDAEAAIALADAAATVAPVDVKGLTGVRFYYDSTTKKMMVEFSVVNVEGKTTGPYKSADVVKGANLNGGIKQKTCTEWERAIYSFTYEGFTVLSTQKDVKIDGNVDTEGNALQSQNSDETGYIRTPGTKPVGHVLNPKASYVITDAGHEKTGKGVYFRECSVCHGVLPDNQYTGSRMQLEKPGVLFTDASYGKAAAGARTDIINGQSYTFEIYDIDKTAHTYDEQHPYIVYMKEDPNQPIYDADGNTTGYVKRVAANNEFIDTWNVEGTDDKADIFKPVNCHMLPSGEMVADSPEVAKDAYYYYIVKCTSCHTVKFSSSVYLQNREGSIVGTYYEKVEGGNIKGC